MMVSREGDQAEHVWYQVGPNLVFAAISTLPYGVPGLITPGREGVGGLTSVFFFILNFKFTIFLCFCVVLERN